VGTPARQGCIDMKKKEKEFKSLQGNNDNAQRIEGTTIEGRVADRVFQSTSWKRKPLFEKLV